MLNLYTLKEKCFVKNFISKKNDVSLYKIVDDRGKKQYVVIKKFKSDDSYKNELDVYQRLISIQDKSKLIFNYPKLLGYNDKKLLLALDYIKGHNILEKIEYYESINCISKISEILIAVFEWLNQFYSVIDVTGNEVLGDVNLRNFIISENGIYGLDFENVKLGNRKSEMIQVLAFYMLYEPIKSDIKKKVVNLVRKKYLEQKIGVHDIDMFSSLLEEEINRIQIRRKKIIKKEF